MSDNLRDALENLVEDWAGKPSSYLRETAGLLRELLAAHPVEPAPVASRERVAEVMHDYDMAHSWRDERFCPSYACMEVYPPRADALLAAGVFREGKN